MSCTRTMLGALAGGIVGGGLSAVLEAASGAIGAAIFKSAGYSDYDATEAAQMGAIGGAILGGTSGVAVGALLGCASSRNISPSAGAAGTAAAGVGGWITASAYSVLNGLVGYAVLNHREATETVMNLGETALSFLVGGAIVSVGAVPAVICIAIPCICAGAVVVAATSDKTPELKETPDLESGTDPKPKLELEAPKHIMRPR